MKKLIQICMLSMLMLSITLFNQAAAQEQKPTPKPAAKPAPMHKPTHQAMMPYVASYSSHFTIGDPKYSRIVLDLWKDYDENNLDKHAHLLADTITAHSSSGEMKKGKDIVLDEVKKHRAEIAEVKTTVHAWVSLHSVDKNENWVAIWGSEEDTWKDGKKTVTDIHEVWRFNKAGKVDLVRSFEAKAPMP